MRLTWRAAYIVIMIFLAVAIGPLFYLDYAKRLHKYDVTGKCLTTEMEKARTTTPLPWIKYKCGENSWPRPDYREWIAQWLQGALVFLFLAAIPAIWSFFLNRLREISKAIRGIE